MRNALALPLLLSLLAVAPPARSQSAPPPAPSAKPPSPAPTAPPSPKTPAAKPAPPPSEAPPAPTASAAPPAPAPTVSAAPPAPAATTTPPSAAQPDAVAPAPAPPPPAATAEAPPAELAPVPPPAVPPPVKDEPASPGENVAPAPSDSGAPAGAAASDPWRDAHALGAEFALSFGARLGSAGFSPSDEERGGLGFDLGAWLPLSREYALGFGVTRADLGSVSSLSGSNQVTSDYAATAVHFGARAFPWRGESSELFLGLRVGLVWQDLGATGLRTLEPNVAPPSVFSCSGVDGPALGLGAGIGFAERVARRLWFLGRVDANGYRLSGDVIDGCAVGIGTVTTASLGVGVLYAFDLGEENRLARPSRPAYTW